MGNNPRHPKINKSSVETILEGLENNHRNAQSQRTSNSGSHFIPSGEVDENGQPTGAGTIVGGGANGGSISPWVNDTTAPGVPIGLTVFSESSIIFVTWDGTLQDGTPPDFDHVSIYVDGVEKTTFSNAGTYPTDTYEPDSIHAVTARAWDNAHAADGKPKPNGSTVTDPMSVTVKGAVDVSQIEDAQHKAQEALDKASEAKTTADGKNRIFASAGEPSHDGLAKGDLWMQLDSDGHVSGIQVWNGSSFQDYVLMAKQVLVAGSVGTINLEDGAITADKVTASDALLEKLLVRKVKADEIDVGSLSAAIVQSGRFVTSDGLTGFDETGFWSKDKNGNILFNTSENGVKASGGFVTSISGNRVQLSQTLINGTNIGGLQGIDDNSQDPYWLIWGSHQQNGNDVNSSLFMGVSQQQPEFAANSNTSGNNASVTANHVAVSGTKIELYGNDIVSVDGTNISIQNLPANFKDYDTDSVMTFEDNVVNYRNFMRLYKRAGVFFLEFNVQGKDDTLFPQGQLVPCVTLSNKVMPASAIDVWAYGAYGTLVRVHVFGSGEAYPQGTISVTAKDRSTNYVSGQLYWAQQEEAYQ